VRLQRRAELAVTVEIEARGIGETERRRRAGVGAIAAFTDPLHRDALGPQADHERTEVLGKIVDELAVGREVEDLLVENPVMADLRAQQHAGAFQRRAPLSATGSRPPASCSAPVVERTYSRPIFGTTRLSSRVQ
jgi:hypothetical protein